MIALSSPSLLRLSSILASAYSFDRKQFARNFKSNPIEITPALSVSPSINSSSKESPFHAAVPQWIVSLCIALLGKMERSLFADELVEVLGTSEKKT